MVQLPASSVGICRLCCLEFWPQLRKTANAVTAKTVKSLSPLTYYRRFVVARQRHFTSVSCLSSKTFACILHALPVASIQPCFFLSSHRHLGVLLRVYVPSSLLPVIVAVSTLSDLSSTLLESFNNLINRGSAPDTSSLYAQLSTQLSTYSTAALTTVIATVLALLFLFTRFLMSYRESFSHVGGRASPYVLNHNDRSISDMFEYVDDDYRPQNARSEVPIEDDDAPDIINIRAAKNTFKAEFPPFSISESRVFVSDLRRYVARRLGEDPRKIRLEYKDRDLRNDARSLKFYGCKQNSEVSVFVTENVTEYGTIDNHSSEDDALRPPSHVDRRRSRAGSSVRDRQSYHEDQNRMPNTSGYLQPGDYIPTTRPPQRSYSTSRPAPTPTRSRRDPSPASSQPSITSVPPSPRRSTHLVDPDSPMGQVLALQAKFDDKYYPEAKKFLASPPSDPTVWQNHYNQVVENLMKHIIEAADGITTGEDKDARAERRKVVTWAQEVLKQLDTARERRAR